MVRNRKDEKGPCRNIELVSSTLTSSSLFIGYSRTCKRSYHDWRYDHVTHFQLDTTKLEQVSSSNWTDSLKFVKVRICTVIWDHWAREIVHAYYGVRISRYLCQRVFVRHVSADASNQGKAGKNLIGWLRHARSRDTDKKKRDIGNNKIRDIGVNEVPGYWNQSGKIGILESWQVFRS